jgi:hypothetical protein
MKLLSDRLVLEHRSFALGVAKRKARRWSALQWLGDLEGAAMVGLVEAARRVERVGLSGNFEAYCGKAIVGSVVDEFIFLHWGRREGSGERKAKIPEEVLYEEQGEDFWDGLLTDASSAAESSVVQGFLGSLSVEERRLVKFLSEGWTWRETADFLQISPSSLGRRLGSVKGKFGVYFTGGGGGV